MMDGTNATNQFSSHIFNISKNSTSPPDTSKGSGLSSQAKVGIGVGVGVGCAFLIALAAAIWYRRRAQNNANAATQFYGAPGSQPPAPASVVVEKDSNVHPQASVEVLGGPRAELPAQGPRYELPL